MCKKHVKKKKKNPSQYLPLPSPMHHRDGHFKLRFPSLDKRDKISPRFTGGECFVLKKAQQQKTNFVEDDFLKTFRTLKHWDYKRETTELPPFRQDVLEPTSQPTKQQVFSNLHIDCNQLQSLEVVNLSKNARSSFQDANCFCFSGGWNQQTDALGDNKQFRIGQGVGVSGSKQICKYDKMIQNDLQMWVSKKGWRSNKMVGCTHQILDDKTDGVLGGPSSITEEIP